ncbi:cold shock domain-containing protein [Streptomyces virginiae]|uniref:cold shock domain-containing protein n=1 Tax=Streptomyces virginiae TaxID=1961 RepID=UPI003319912B
MKEPRTKGLIQTYNADRGYGFVVPYGGQDPVYFKCTAFADGLKVVSEGQQVSFHIVLDGWRHVAEDIQS